MFYDKAAMPEMAVDMWCGKSDAMERQDETSKQV